MDKLNMYDISTPIFTLNGIKTYARLVDVYDGDTVTCVFPILGDNYYKFNIRLNGIDTAEIKSENKLKALEARHKILEYLCKNYTLKEDCSRSDIQNFLKQNTIIVWIKCYNFDKYGRILGDIYNDKDTKESISDMLLQVNLAYKYNGGAKLHFIKN
jgi:endonuclease YncB( thermonuclease family)